MNALGKFVGRRGFTLIELLAVIVVLFIVFAMLLPTSGDPNHKAPFIACMNNQRQNVLGFTMWNGDHGDKFPWEVSATNSGTMELADTGEIVPNFQLLTNYINAPRNFVCPTDKLKVAATDEKFLTVSNISYFLALDATTNLMNEILSGDRHLAFNGSPVKPGLVIWKVGEKVQWTRELHEHPKTLRGVLSFRDGHCEGKVGDSMNSAFPNQDLPIQRLVMP